MSQKLKSTAPWLILPAVVLAIAVLGLLPPAPSAIADTQQTPVDENGNPLNPTPKSCCECYELHAYVDSPADDLSSQNDEDDDTSGCETCGECEEDAPTSPSEYDSQDQNGEFSFSVELYKKADPDCEEAGGASVEVTDGNGKTIPHASAQGDSYSYKVNPLENPGPYRAHLVCNGSRCDGTSEEIPGAPGPGIPGPLPGPQDLLDGSDGAPGNNISLPNGDAACSGGACAPVTKLGLKGVDMTVPVGTSKQGDYKTSLVLSLKNIVGIVDSSALRIRGRAGYTLTKDNLGRIKTVTTDTVFTEIVQNADFATPTADSRAYEIRLSVIGVGGNTLFRTVRVGKDAGKLVITETDTLLNSVRVTEYTQTPDLTQMVMSTGITAQSPLGLCKVTRTVNETGPNTKLRMTVEKAFTDNQQNDTFQTTFDCEYNLVSYPWGLRTVSKIVDPDGNTPLTTTWSYYNYGEITGPGASTAGLGMLKSMTRPNGYTEDHVYGRNLHIITKPYGADDTITETRSFDPVTNTLTVTKKVDNDIISKYQVIRVKPGAYKTYSALQPGDDPATHTINNIIIREFTSVDPERYEETSIYFYPVGSEYGGLVKSVFRAGGNHTTYGYGRPAGADQKIVTITRRPAGVTDGTSTVTAYNAFGEMDYTRTTAIGALAGTTLASQTATSRDYLGRPTTISHLDGAYTTSISYGCCGVETRTDRYGALTTYFRDALKRITRVARRRAPGTASIDTVTTYNGRTTTVHRVTGQQSLLVSRTTRSLNGLVVTSESPDADGNGSTAHITTRTTQYPQGGGSKTTVVHPDNTTTGTTSFTDGRTATSTDQLGNITTYSYGAHSFSGGGLSTTVTAPGGDQWSRSYTDLMGRNIRTEFPHGNGTVASTRDYYDSSDAPSASRDIGRLKSSTDPDGVTTTYTYTSRAEPITSTPVAGGQTRVSYSSSTLVAGSESTIGIARKTSSYVRASNTGVDKLVSVSYRSIDGLRTRSVPLGDANLASTSSMVIPVPGNGSWTALSTTADGQTTKQTYTQGWLRKTEVFDNQGTTPADLIASTTLTYDAFGRTLTTTDSRTGVTTVGGYLENGAVTSVITNGGADTTAYTYDVMGRRITTTLPDNTRTRTSYTDRGQTEAVWGYQTYPRIYTYDALGRMKTLRTRPNQCKRPMKRP